MRCATSAQRHHSASDRRETLRERVSSNTDDITTLIMMHILSDQPYGLWLTGSTHTHTRGRLRNLRRHDTQVTRSNKLRTRPLPRGDGVERELRVAQQSGLTRRNHGYTTRRSGEAAQPVVPSHRRCRSTTQLYYLEELWKCKRLLELLVWVNKLYTMDSTFYKSLPWRKRLQRVQHLKYNPTSST